MSDHERLLDIIISHRISGVISLAEANIMFIVAFQARDIGLEPPRFKSLLTEVRA